MDKAKKWEPFNHQEGLPFNQSLSLVINLYLRN